jgi:hypothetical protein
MPPYFTAVFLTFSIWLVLFTFNKHSRKEMAVLGLIIAPFVLLDVITVPSYWSPVTLFNIPVGIEGFLFTFFITGIAAVIYEQLFKKSYRFGHLHIALAYIFVIPILISLFAVYVLSMNIIYFFIIAFLLMASCEIVKRRDLLINSLFSAFVFCVIYIILFTIWLYMVPDSLNWWNFDNLSNIRIGAVPMEEVLFSLSFGAFVGPLYEYLTDAHLRRTKKNR